MLCARLTGGEGALVYPAGKNSADTSRDIAFSNNKVRKLRVVDDSP